MTTTGPRLLGLSADSLFAVLRSRLAGNLPGRGASRPWAHELSYGRHAGPAPCDARPASVLVLLYPCRGEWHVPLLLRPAAMSAHAGQVAFPGGMREGDESPFECACREAFEELGIDPRTLTPLGQLSPLYIFASNFRVTACVAGTSVTPGFRPDPGEVDELLELPLCELWNERRLGRHVVQRQGVSFEVPHLEWRGRYVWGATRLILGELQAILSD